MFNKDELRFIRYVSPKKKPTSQRDREDLSNEKRDIQILAKFAK